MENENGNGKPRGRWRVMDTAEVRMGLVVWGSSCGPTPKGRGQLGCSWAAQADPTKIEESGLLHVVALEMRRHRRMGASDLHL